MVVRYQRSSYQFCIRSGMIRKVSSYDAQNRTRPKGWWAGDAGTAFERSLPKGSTMNANCVFLSDTYALTYWYTWSQCSSGKCSPTYGCICNTCIIAQPRHRNVSKPINHLKHILGFGGFLCFFLFFFLQQGIKVWFKVKRKDHTAFVNHRYIPVIL